MSAMEPAEASIEAWSTALIEWSNQNAPATARASAKDVILGPRYVAPATGSLALLRVVLDQIAHHDVIYRGWVMGDGVPGIDRAQYQEIDASAAGAVAGDDLAKILAGCHEDCFYMVSTLLHGTWRADDLTDRATVVIDRAAAGPAVCALLGPRNPGVTDTITAGLCDVFPIADEGEALAVIDLAGTCLEVGTKVLVYPHPTAADVAATQQRPTTSSSGRCYLPCQLDSVEFTRDDNLPSMAAVNRPAYYSFTLLNTGGSGGGSGRRHIRLAAVACSVLPWPARSLAGDTKLVAASALTHAILSTPHDAAPSAGKGTVAGASDRVRAPHNETQHAIQRAVWTTHAVPRAAAALQRVAAGVRARAAALARGAAGVDPEAVAWAGIRGLRGLNPSVDAAHGGARDGDGEVATGADGVLRALLVGGGEGEGEGEGEGDGQLALRLARDLCMRTEEVNNVAALPSPLPLSPVPLSHLSPSHTRCSTWPAPSAKCWPSPSPCPPTPRQTAVAAARPRRRRPPL